MSNRKHTRPKFTPLPVHLRKRGASGKLICQCGKGAGSEYDGLCFKCRGVTAYEASVREQLDILRRVGPT